MTTLHTIECKYCAYTVEVSDSGFSIVEYEPYVVAEMTYDFPTNMSYSDIIREICKVERKLNIMRILNSYSVQDSYGDAAVYESSFEDVVNDIYDMDSMDDLITEVIIKMSQMKLDNNPISDRKPQ